MKEGKEMEAPEGSTVIESPGDYPHLFIRVQLKNDADKANVLPIQQGIILTSNGSKELIINNPIKHWSAYFNYSFRDC